MPSDATRWSKRQVGWWSRPFLGGFLLRQGTDGPFHYEVGRGALAVPAKPRTGDVWGRWDCPEPEAMERAAAMHADLERVGWFTQPDPPHGEGYGMADLEVRIRKLPRSVHVPSYFLAGADRHALSQGRAMVGGRLRIGGIDVMAEDGKDPLPMGAIRRVAILPPGGKVTDKHGFRLWLGGEELEALAGFLLDLAATVASSRTAIRAANVPAPADLPGGVRERFSRMREIRRHRDEAIAALSRATPEQAAAIAAFARRTVGDDATDEAGGRVDDAA